MSAATFCRSVFLAVTGCEALYADMGHFSRRAIRLSFSSLAYPCLILTYCGQASWLMRNQELAADVYFSSLPKPVFWPMLVLATLTSIVASQVCMLRGKIYCSAHKHARLCLPSLPPPLSARLHPFHHDARRR